MSTITSKEHKELNTFLPQLQYFLNTKITLILFDCLEIRLRYEYNNGDSEGNSGNMIESKEELANTKLLFHGLSDSGEIIRCSSSG